MTNLSEPYWTWSDGRAWKEEYWAPGEPDGLQGQNCLKWKDWGPTKWGGKWGSGWGDGTCSEKLDGFICNTPTALGNLENMAKLVYQSLDQGVSSTDLWGVVLKQRWTVDILNHAKGSAYCLDISEEASVIEKIRAELNIVNKNDTKLFETEKYLPQVLESYSLLHFCPPQHLVEAVKLGIFYENLLENENLRTVVMATMNNIRPDNQFKNKALLHKLFIAMEKEFNGFKLGPALIALSSASELKQLAKLDLPYLKDYIDLVNKCVDDLECVDWDHLVQSSGKI